MSPRTLPADTPDIFAYLDYRAFLKDYYELRKSTSQFSYRVFSMRAKLKSPNYLKLVIEGQRNLTVAMAERFARACGLQGKTQEFFVALVQFGQAKNAEEREAHYRGLRRFHSYRAVHRLDAAQDTYHSKWYLPAIRELVDTVGFREDPVWIADKLLPKITVAQAEASIDTLLQLGMLKRDRQGHLRQAEKVVSTGSDKVKSLHVRAYHRSMLQHATTSMDRLPSSQRDISSLTLKGGANGLQLIKERLAQVRRELIELSESQSECTRIVHVGFQAFSLSSDEEEEQ